MRSPLQICYLSIWTQYRRSRRPHCRITISLLGPSTGDLWDLKYRITKVYQDPVQGIYESPLQNHYQSPWSQYMRTPIAESLVVYLDPEQEIYKALTEESVYLDPVQKIYGTHGRITISLPVPGTGDQ